MINIEPYGDRAFLARFANGETARGWYRTVQNARLTGVIDLVLAYDVVAIHGNPDECDLDDLRQKLSSLPISTESERDGSLLSIPVLYDGDDLPEIASKLVLSTDQIIEFHSQREYRVQAIGFLPGFPYCGDLGNELSGLLRRSSPRTRVPAGSVAIVGNQTGIYPAESPGGWHLIGRTPLVIADLDREFFPIIPGDRVRFEPIGALEYRERAGELLGIASSGRLIPDRL